MGKLRARRPEVSYPRWAVCQWDEVGGGAGTMVRSFQ